MLCVDNKYDAIILNNEYFTELKIGEKLENLRVIKVYEDGKLGLSPRGERATELDTLEKAIMSYLEGNDGFMRFNDKSSPEEIKTVLGKRNYVILIISLILIIIGYILMSGEGSTLAAYNPDIFSGTRIRIAPLLCLLGYLLNVFGILYRPRQRGI